MNTKIFFHGNFRMFIQTNEFLVNTTFSLAIYFLMKMKIMHFIFFKKKNNKQKELFIIWRILRCQFDPINSWLIMLYWIMYYINYIIHNPTKTKGIVYFICM